jgi:hypothetical protein
MASHPGTKPKANVAKVFVGVCVVIVLLVLLGAIVAQSVLPADRISSLDSVNTQTASASWDTSASLQST